MVYKKLSLKNCVFLQNSLPHIIKKLHYVAPTLGYVKSFCSCCVSFVDGRKY